MKILKFSFSATFNFPTEKTEKKGKGPMFSYWGKLKTQKLRFNFLKSVTPKIYELFRPGKRWKSDRNVNPRFFSTFIFHFLIRVAPAGGGKVVKVKATTRKKYLFFTFLSLFQFWFVVEFVRTFSVSVRICLNAVTVVKKTELINLKITLKETAKEIAYTRIDQG